jgi:hypothetical protein
MVTMTRPAPPTNTHDAREPPIRYDDGLFASLKATVSKKMVNREGDYNMNEVCINDALAATYSFGIIMQFDTIPHLNSTSRKVG